MSCIFFFLEGNNSSSAVKGGGCASISHNWSQAPPIPFICKMSYRPDWFINPRLMWTIALIRLVWSSQSCSTLHPPSTLYAQVLFLGKPFGIFSHSTVCIFVLRLDIQEETQASSYLVSHVYLSIWGWRAVVFRCDHAPATRSKNIHPHMCYKRHFVAIIEFDFFVEQHLLCTQLKMGLLMSRGEDWRKGYMFAAPESMPLSPLDCNAGWMRDTFKISCSPHCKRKQQLFLYLFSAITGFKRFFQ